MDKLKTLTVIQLKQLCKKYNIKNYSKLKKLELITLLLDNNINIINDDNKDSKNIINEDNKQLKFIDLFAGIGGFHQALTNLGFKCVYACDIDINCRNIYKENYNMEVDGDIRDINIKNIPKFDILCAGFPCQPFSKAGKQDGFYDSRGTLFFNICQIIEEHKPKYIILENVKNLVTHDEGNTWNVIYNNLIKLGYNTYENPLILNTLNFNIAQNRERVIIICKRKDLGDLPERPIINKIDKNSLTLDNIMDSKYNDIEIDDKLKNIKEIWNKFIKICNDNNIEIPKYPIWTDYWNMENYQNDNKYQKYKNWIDKNVKFYNDNKLLLDNWLITSRNNKYWIGSFRKLEWQTSLKNVNLDNLLWSPRSSGIRVKNANYIPTIVAINNTPIYGPYNRKLHIKELLKLQSFKDDFKYHEKHIYKQIGNAVNVKMIMHVTKFLINNIDIFNNI